MKNNLIRLNNFLSWKLILAVNLLVFFSIITFFSILVLRVSTENRSQASNNVSDIQFVEKAKNPYLNPSKTPPNKNLSINRVEKFFGKVGDIVLIKGEGFGNSQLENKLFVGEILSEPDNIIRWSDALIEVKIPEKASTGRVWIESGDKQVYWSGKLIIYDPSNTLQLAFIRNSTNSGIISVLGGESVTGGLVELQFEKDKPMVKLAEGLEGKIDQILGESKNMIIKFSITNSSSDIRTPLLNSKA
jgi:hypothetical protein